MSTEFRFAATLDRLQAQMKTAGIPLTGISPRQPEGDETPHFVDRGQGFFVELHFGPSATAPQRALAAQILAAFSFERRRPRSRASLMADVQALTAAQRNQLVAAMAVDFLQREPDFAQKLGINLDGDEVAPKQMRER